MPLNSLHKFLYENLKRVEYDKAGFSSLDIQIDNGQLEDEDMYAKLSSPFVLFSIESVEHNFMANLHSRDMITISVKVVQDKLDSISSKPTGMAGTGTKAEALNTKTERLGLVDYVRKELINSGTAGIGGLVLQNTERTLHKHYWVHTLRFVSATIVDYTPEVETVPAPKLRINADLHIDADIALPSGQDTQRNKDYSFSFSDRSKYC